MSDELTLDDLIKAKDLLRPRRRTQEEIAERQAWDKRYADWKAQWTASRKAIDENLK